MIPPKFQIHGWKRAVLIVLITIGAIGGGLKWAEKQFVQLDFRDDDGCVGYEFHFYRAFSLWDVALYFVPIGIGDRDHPRFVRVIEKKTGRKIGETSIYWMSTAPYVFCPDKEHPNQIRIYFGGSNDEHEEIFEVNS